MKLLFVSKDLGGGQMAAPLAKLAIENGDQVTVVAEGLAPQEFAKHGVPLFFQGTPNFREIQFELQVSRLLSCIQPDLIIATLGSPINLERLFCSLASFHGIPLVLLEDCHGAHVRIPETTVPHLVLTVDDFAVRLVKERYPTSKAAIIGHPGVPTSDEVMTMRDQHYQGFPGYWRLYTFVGGDPGATDEQLKLLVACLEQTSGAWSLVPRFHPKWVTATDPATGRTYGQTWQELLAPIAKNVIEDEVGNGKLLVASADVAIADYSTLLTTAICCGKTAIFLETPAVAASMQQNMGLDVFPLVELGLCHRVTESTDLSILAPPEPSAVSCLRPYEPLVAYGALQALHSDRASGS